MASNGKRRHSDEEDTPQKKGRTKSKNYQSVYVPFKSMHSSYNCPPDVINKSSVASTSTAFHVNNSGNVDGTRKKETYFIPHDVYKTGYLVTNPVLCIHNVIENLKKTQEEAKLPTSSPKKLDILTTSSYKSATPSTSKQYDDFSCPGPTKNGGDKKVSDLKKLLTKPPHYGRLDALLQKKQKIMIDNDNEHSITKEVNSREKNNMTAEGRPEKPPENVTKTINVMIKQSTKLLQTVTKRNDKAQKQNDYVSAVLHNKELEMIPILNCSNQNTQQHVELKIETIKNRNTLEADEENDQSAEEKITVNDSQSQLNVGIETNQIELKTELLKDDENQEYHPAYKKFIDTCLKTENSEDMEKIIRIKIKKYYRQCSREYVESPKFIEMVLSAIASIEAEPKHLYKHIKKVVDELDTERMLARSQQTMNKNAASDSETKKSKKIRELQKMLTTLHTNIQAFEQQEVDLDDEESSTFLLAERLKSRFVKVHKMFCKLTNAKLKTEPRITIEPREGVPKGPTKRLQMLINKRVPYGAPFPFPDYHDVLNCVRQANDEDGLGWSNSEIEAEAKYLFEEFGSKLKTRRQLRDREITIVSRITPDCLDPAELDETLRFKLHLNDITAGLFKKKFS
ncbi:uncharacterized protein LOC121729267 isoform X2 [Aricia agestis]|uniref:uncharacterized protein LOC121729267 isoform X2 n=1 Tax=Aricia agestis TaxID=91739 RepID=UPI001C2060E5|nr:uncharacterized protein LOC121729267 isoform X2 [Aricia agestis]